MLRTDASGSLTLPLLAVPEMMPPKGALGRWLVRGAPADERHGTQTYPWYSVLWLTGVDYFSTLGYQPGIALLAAGALSPLATLLLVLVTLGGALPVYVQVAQRSFTGQGSIAMLEKLLPGWWGKLFVLILLGFASTDFVITMTLSASDAAEHMVHNPFLAPYLAGYQLSITLLLLTLLAVGVPYILLNLIVIGRSFLEIGRHPELLLAWRRDLLRHGDWTMLLLSAGLIFPKLALGLSGFETGVSVMPWVRGDPGDVGRPIGRIRASCRLLTRVRALDLIDDPPDPTGRLCRRRACGRSGTGLPKSSAARRRVRDRLRQLDHRDSVVRRSVSHGGHAQSDPTLPPALRDGPCVGKL